MCLPSRKLPALCVTILSVVVLLTGFIMIVESILFYTDDTILQQDDLGSITQYKEIFRYVSFSIMILVSLIVTITGCVGAGCLLPPFRSFKIFSVCFGISLTIVWMSVLISGILITAFAASS